MNEENGLPRGWVWTTLGNVTGPIRISVQPKEFPALPFVGMEHVEAETMKLIGTVPASELKSNAVRFWPGDVLYGRLRPYLNKVLRPDFEGLCSAEFLVFRESPNLNSHYLQYFLNSWSFKEFASHLNEGDRPRVDWSQLQGFQFPLAPSPEQQRIVAAIEQQFSRLDAGVAALRQAQAKLKRYRAAVLKAAVEGKLTETWRAEHPATEPAYELLERILVERRAKWEANLRAKGKDPAKVKYVEPAKPDVENLLGLSEGWCWATAEQLSDESRAITYGVVKLGAPVAGGISTLRSSNVRHLRFDLEGLKSISPNIANEYRRTFLQGGEILVTVRGTLGGVAVVPTSFAGYNISREVAMIALVLPYIAPCLVLFIGSPPIQNWMMRSAKGIAYTGINIETLKEMPIPVPPRNEQEQIVSEVERRLSVVSQLEATVEANLKRAERLRQSILREAFAGRLVPQNPDDEPASVLLERIRGDRDGRKHGTVNKGHVVNVAVGKPVKIDVREARQVELWESIKGGE